MEGRRTKDMKYKIVTDWIVEKIKKEHKVQVESFTDKDIIKETKESYLIAIKLKPQWIAKIHVQAIEEEIECHHTNMTIPNDLWIKIKILSERAYGTQRANSQWICGIINKEIDAMPDDVKKELDDIVALENKKRGK